MGTDEWVSEFVNDTGVNKDEKKFLRDVIRAGSTSNDVKGELILMEFNQKLLYWSHRIIFKFGLLLVKIFAKPITKLNPDLNIYELQLILKVLEIKSTKDITLFMDRYAKQIAPIIFAIAKENRSIGNPVENFTIYRDESGLKLLIPFDDEYFLNHIYRLYVINQITEIQISGVQEKPFICPFGKIIYHRDNEFDFTKIKNTNFFYKTLFDGCAEKTECGLKKLFAKFEIPINILCSQNSKATLFRNFGDGKYISCGDISFDIVFFENKKESSNKENTSESKFVDDFRKVVWQNNKNEKNESDKDVSSEKTSNKNKKKSIRSISILMDNNKKYMQECAEDGTPKIKGLLVLSILNLIAFPFLFLFDLLSLIPRLFGLVIKSIYKISIFPQSLNAKIKMKKHVSKYENSVKRSDEKIRFILESVIRL